jgi:hypothetical protein
MGCAQQNPSFFKKQGRWVSQVLNASYDAGAEEQGVCHAETANLK